MQHIHFIGIGGTGLSAIARVLLESGYEVSGSDRLISPFAEMLQTAGARIDRGHRAENVQGADLVIRSSAVPDDNPEVQAALVSGIPVLKRSDFLGRLMADKLGIAVAGTHGKTTTTAMIAWMLVSLGEDPTYIIGGVSRNLGSNAHAGKGRAFVIEADEYDRMFLGLRYQAAVVTSLEYDHPDCFPTKQDYYQAFRDFADLAPADGALIICTDDRQAGQLLRDVRQNGKKALGYGLQAAGLPDYSIKNRNLNETGSFSFDVALPPHSPANQPPLPNGGSRRVHVDLQAPGEHNMRNALAALAQADWLNLPLDRAAKALGEYTGVGRRFEVIGEASGITVISDYGHHPTEIRATLAAARNRFPQRSIWAVWQPHTYSRTLALFTQFAGAFEDAHHVLVTEVYPAREPVMDKFSSRQVVAAMSHKDAHFVAGLSEAASYLFSHMRGGDVLIVFSAGDADQVCGQVLASLNGRSKAHD